MIIAANIKRIRKDKNLSHIDLAKKTKLSREYLWQIENGDRNPTVQTLEKIAKGLRMNLEELLK